MNSLIRMIAGTLVRAQIYKGIRKLPAELGIALAVVGGLLYVLMSR